MPVLARLIEAAGIPTVTVTMMPALAAAVLAPRIVGVEFPYGHPFGMPADRAMQRTVLETALTVLSGPGVGLATALTFGLLPIVNAAEVRPLAVIRETSEEGWGRGF